ncbi:hypothetical protein OPQ81_007230 [Rhizoctonia solani]|nr:hypothetical protein OPQ81_007230 [Rhizoctonia solani]
MRHCLSSGSLASVPSSGSCAGLADSVVASGGGLAERRGDSGGVRGGVWCCSIAELDPADSCCCLSIVTKGRYQPGDNYGEMNKLLSYPASRAKRPRPAYLLNLCLRPLSRVNIGLLRAHPHGYHIYIPPQAALCSLIPRPLDHHSAFFSHCSMSCDIKVQSAFEHERWMAHKSTDRLKGKRVPRCTCSFCLNNRLPSTRGRNGRIAVHVDDHDIDGLALGSRDVEDEFFMEAVHASTQPTMSARAAHSTEVPLIALIREPRRRKVDILEDFEIIRPTRAVLALDDDGFGVSNRHVGRDELEEWEDVGLVSEAKGPAKLVATSARSYAEVLSKA